jgi:hypothetical protein
MDRVGVDDPEAEQNTIRSSEQTDAALNPAAVQVMAQLAQVLQSMGFQNAEQATAAAMGGQGRRQPVPEGPGPGMNDMRSSPPGAAAGQSGRASSPCLLRRSSPVMRPRVRRLGPGPRAN